MPETRVYVCPPWCKFKDAEVERWEGAYEAHKHDEYAANMSGSDAPDPNAPMHESDRVDLFDVSRAESPRTHNEFKSDVQITQIHGQPMELWLQVWGDGIEALDPLSQALEVAKAFEVAGLRLRRFVADMRPLVEP